MLAARLLEGQLARHRLDPADAGSDGTLAGDAEQGDVAGAADVGAAAQLDRVGAAVLALAHRDDAHLVAVLLAEQRHGTGADRLVAGHDPHAAPRRSGAGTRLTSASTAPDLVGRHRARLAEVEAQPVGRDQRALLRHVLAQMPPQRGMQQVGRGVGAADAVAAGDVDRQLDRVAHGERAAVQRADMDEQVAQPLLRVGHRDHGVADADGAGVADLAAGFAVERGLVGDHHDRAGLGALDRPAVDHQGGDHALGVGGGVAQELGGTQRLAQVEPDRLDRGVARALPGRARGRALAAHGGVEAVAVDGAALRRAGRPGSGRAGSRTCRRA